MPKTNRILFVLYDGFEILDMSGPASVFSTANNLLHTAMYKTILVSKKGGLTTSEGGLAVNCLAIDSVRINKQDSIFVVGANEDALRKASGDKTLSGWLAQRAPQAKRFGSVCSGTHLLGVAGLLENRTVTSHWAACAQLNKQYPNTKINSDALYVQDQNLWTSAGVASGIDMALAIVEQDHGTALKDEVAKWIVVYSHRPGYQSQFSHLLETQTEAQPFGALISWIDANLDQKLSVATLADHANMTERSFHRKFTNAVGLTPAKYVEHAKLAKSKRLLEAGMPVIGVARKIGFHSDSGFRVSFEKAFGLSPSTHRTLHMRVT